ncbi:MAG TPA: helix-turn-helix domain-containing protein [Candidatus Thermoplasmatota archaeon]|nr:helix-turn-helix domain-containing protein [Candidatus Thermoplasmatota archaeon]
MGSYREVTFELVDGRAASPLFLALTADPAASTRLQALSIGPDVVSVLVEHAGAPESVARVRDVVTRGGEPTVLSYDTLEDGARAIRFVAVWRRPDDPSQGVSLEHLLYDTVGASGLLFGRVHEGVIAYKAASPGGHGLREFLEKAQRAFGRRFTVRPLRAGPFRPGWDAGADPDLMDPDERRLVTVALAAGYYDEPKRCGVRELGDALGVSKSVVARRLRLLERKALQALAD